VTKGCLRTDGARRLSPGLAALWLVLFVALVSSGLLVPSSRAQQKAAAAQSASQAQRGVRIPLELNGNHVLIQGRVNNSAPLWFTVDTGAAVSVINVRRARELNLQMEGTGSARGAGGSAQSSRVSNVTFNLQGLELKNLSMITLALDSIEATSGRSMDVILGADLFMRYVVEIDYANKLLTIYEPDQFTYGGKGESLPLKFAANHPYVTGKISIAGMEAIEGEFVIDAGSNFGITLVPSFFNSRKLLDHIPKTIQSKARGVGGEFPMAIGRVEGLELGSFKLEKPVAAFPQTSGFIAREGAAGNIGGLILRRFKVTFDYPHKRMILEPNPNFKEPFEIDMSGLALITESPEFRLRKISRVLENSPAAEAGLKAEDLLLEVNGRAASDLTLSGLREMFRQEGQEYELKIKRGAETMQLKLKTRRLI
jgi:hypothetical protein